MEDTTPESRYPAEREDLDTIITGPDGKDYVVDTVEGFKKWVPYLPEPSDVVIIEKILTPDLALPTAEEIPKKSPNKYQMFLKTMTEKLKKEEPDLLPKDRMKKIQQLWKEQK